ALQRLVPQAPTKERAQGLIPAPPPARDQQLGAQAELALPGQHSAPQERPQPRRHAQSQPFREFLQTSLHIHIGLTPILVRAYHPIPQTEPPAKLDVPRLLRQKGIGPALDDEVADPLGEDLTAQARRGLDRRALGPAVAMCR